MEYQIIKTKIKNKDKYKNKKDKKDKYKKQTGIYFINNIICEYNGILICYIYEIIFVFIFLFLFFFIFFVLIKYEVFQI